MRPDCGAGEWPVRRIAPSGGWPGRGIPVLSGGAFGLTAHELEPARTRIDRDVRAVTNLAGQHLAPERGLDFALNYSAQWARAIDRIIPVLCQIIARFVRQLQLDLTLGEPLAQAAELNLHDLAQLVFRKRMEHDDLIYAVQELRPEALAQDVERLLLHPLVVL